MPSRALSKRADFSSGDDIPIANQDRPQFSGWLPLVYTVVSTLLRVPLRSITPFRRWGDLRPPSEVSKTERVGVVTGAIPLFSSVGLHHGSPP